MQKSRLQLITSLYCQKRLLVDYRKLVYLKHYRTEYNSAVYQAKIDV